MLTSPWLPARMMMIMMMMMMMMMMMGTRFPKNYIYKLPIDRLSGCYWYREDYKIRMYRIRMLPQLFVFF